MSHSRGTIASFSYACLPPRLVRLDYNLAEGENFGLTIVFGRNKLRRHHGQQPGKRRSTEVQPCHSTVSSLLLESTDTVPSVTSLMPSIHICPCAYVEVSQGQALT